MELGIKKSGAKVANALTDTSQLKWQRIQRTSDAGMQCDATGVYFFKDGIAIGVTDTLIVGTSSAHFVDGVCDGFVSGASLSGTFNPNNIKATTVVKG